MFQGVWQHRRFIAAGIRAEFTGRFARSRIGALWHILHPLSLALVFALVLSRVMAAKLDGIDNEAGYAVFLLAGIAAWGLFSEMAGRGATMFIEAAGAIRKIAFPKSVIPVTVLGTALLNHALLLASVAAVYLLLGHAPGWHWLFLPAATLLLAAFGLAVGLISGVLNTFARDVGQVMSVALNLWFWLTPIVYPASAVPDAVRPLLALNPLAPIVAAYQEAMAYQAVPDLSALLPAAWFTAGLLALALALFRRGAAEMADVL